MKRNLQRWLNWSAKVFTAVLIASLSAVAKDAYDKLHAKPPIGATSSVQQEAPAPTLALDVTPAFRRSWFHGFLWFGHTDYQLTYRVTISNNGSSEAPRLPMQFSATSGYLTEIHFPPIVRASLIGAPQAIDWNDPGHDHEQKAIGFEIDQPPNGSVTTMTVAIISTTGFPPDSDLTVQMTLPSLLISASGSSVTWPGK